MRGLGRLVGILGGAAVALAAPAGAHAATATVFPIPTAGADATDVAAAPDGSLWFTEHHAGALGHVTLDGRISEVTVPNGTSLDDTDDVGPTQVVADQGGQAMDYLTDIGDTVGSVALDGTLGRRFDNGGSTSAQSISPAPGGGVWEVFYLGDVTARIVRLDGRSQDFGTESRLGLSPMATRADGTMSWGDGSDAIRSFAPTGESRSFPLPAGNDLDPVTSLAFDGGGTLHFTQFFGAGDALLADRGGEIGTVDASGAVRVQSLGGDYLPTSMERGPDGAVWWAEANGIGRLDPATGAVQHASLGNYRPRAIAFGGDGALWFVDADANAVGRVPIDGSTFPAAAPGPVVPGPAAPVAPAPPTPAPTPAVAPRIGVGSPSQRLRTVLARRTITARVSARGPAAVSVRATVSAAVARRLHARVPRGASTLTLARGSARFEAADTRVVRLALTSAGRSSLRRAHGSLAVALRATATAPGATATTAASRLTLAR